MDKRKGFSGGKKYGPPPKRGPNPQGLKSSDKKRLRKAFKRK